MKGKPVHSLLVALLLACGLASLSLAAQSSAPVETTVTLTATLDAGVKQPDWQPSTPAWQRLRCGGYNDGSDDHFYRSFIAFDLASIPADATIKEATLIVHAFDTSPVFSGTASIGVYRVTASWTESITWTQQPTFDPSVLASQNIEAPVPATYAWNVTSLAKGWVTGSYSNHGLMLAGDPPDADPTTGMVNGVAVIRRRSDPDGPQLQVTYTQPAAQEEASVPIPEGGTLLLMSSGLAGLASYVQWRRLARRRS